MRARQKTRLDRRGIGRPLPARPARGALAWHPPSPSPVVRRRLAAAGGEALAACWRFGGRRAVLGHLGIGAFG